MKQTMILYPLDEETSDSEIRMHRSNWKLIKTCLDENKDDEDITFDELLSKMNITEENYLLAIRSSLNTPTIFLKRNYNEVRTNNYNPACLSAWRANMDIQYVLDVYAGAVYIANYISKRQKGMSELLREACHEARQGNNTIKQQLRNRKHLLCFYRVIKTRVEVWENEKCCGNTNRRRVFPQLFRVLPNFHEWLYNSIETRSTCFLFLLENNATRKRKTTC